MIFSHYVDDEYEKFCRRMNSPRVVIDNESCENATVIECNSANKHKILLDEVQILTGLSLIITKANVSSDGGWLMSVFKVTDQDGTKVTDEAILEYIRNCCQSLGRESCFTSSISSVGGNQTMEHTAIELLGGDRPGLLSEVSAILTNRKCNIVNAEVWTHNTRAAFVMHVTDEETGSAIIDPQRLSLIKGLLRNVLGGGNNVRVASSVVTEEVTHTERRLHRMMFADRDYELVDNDDEERRPKVKVMDWSDKGYSEVTIECKDRAKLLFDIVFTLTDMQYVVFHARIGSEGPNAYQEYYIKHKDGSPVKSDAERERVIQCLEAAVKRRVSEGLKLELCTTDRVGLLSDATRIIRENSLTVTRAEVTTKRGKAVNTFYVAGASGRPVESETIESIRQQLATLYE